MTILHISATDNVGGSGRAAYRLHTGLRAQGVRSRMLVGQYMTNDPDVALLRSTPLRALDRAIGKTVDHFGYQYLAYPSTFALPLHPWFRAADVVQLYNTHGGYFNHLALPMLSARKPIVWRLSDCWPMTSHCPFDVRCGNPTFGGRCPNPATYPALARDVTDVLWRAKRWAYAHSQLTIVAPTQWMARMVRESPLLGRSPMYVIPNGVDTEVFRPMPKLGARRALGIPVDQPTICFGANTLDEPRKGAHEFTAALARLASGLRQLVTVLTIGSGGREWRAPAPFVTYTLGHLSDDVALAQAYAAADVFVAPAIADQLPNTILESMACGTPTVAFAVGGIPEVIRHRETGMLAASGDAAGFASGIHTFLDDAALTSACGARARALIESGYTDRHQVEQFLGLYTHVGAGASVR